MFELSDQCRAEIFSLASVNRCKREKKGAIMSSYVLQFLS